MISDEDAARIVAVTHADQLAKMAEDFYPTEVSADYSPAPDEILITGNREFCHYNLAKVTEMIRSGQIANGDVRRIRMCVTDGSPRPEQIPNVTKLPDGQGEQPTAVLGTDEFIRRVSGMPAPEAPAPMTNAQYRAALRDENTPEGVKKAIRKYFKDQEPKSTVKKFIPSQRRVVAVPKMGPAIMGRGIPFVNDVVYKRPAGMSTRQFKRDRKARFREFRQATALVEGAVARFKESASS